MKIVVSLNGRKKKRLRRKILKRIFITQRELNRTETIKNSVICAVRQIGNKRQWEYEWRTRETR
jgi:hypothetical protein